jgi:outer membrane protein assembly factor BamB
MSERDPQNRDRFDNLRDLIDQPVEPRDAFAGELRSRLMRELSANDYSREEQVSAMDATIPPRPPLAFPIESPRRIRPMVILELAAAAIVILGLAATLGRGWFGNDPDPATAIPAAALPGDDTPTPAVDNPTPTEVSIGQPTVMPNEAIPTVASMSDPTMVPNSMIPTVSSEGSFEPTGVPPGNVSGTLWTLPGADGDIVDFGGLLVDDGIVYRLLATTDFVGIQAVDGNDGTVKWQQAHHWTGDLFALEDNTLYFDGGNNRIVAVDAETGAEQWRAQVEGNPIAIAEEDDRLFVLLDTDFVTALDEANGTQLWSDRSGAADDSPDTVTPVRGTWRIAVAGGIVAAISREGVITGFDVTDGTARWSLSGYPNPAAWIDDEDDFFVVTNGTVPGTSIRIDPASGEIQVGASPDDASDSMILPTAAADQTQILPAIALGTPDERTPQIVVGVSDDSGVYYQLSDGTLVKVDAGRMEDNDHREESDDDSDNAPESDD